MKKYLILMILLFSLSAFSLTTLAYYGQFYDSTGSRDTVWMNVVTFDTLGFQANADSVWFLRFYRTTLIDSTILTGAGTRSGYYITGKRAFDGTNYGEYTIQLKWKIQGKYFNKSESYTVFSSDTSDIKTMLINNSFAQTGTDKIWRLRGLAIRGISGSDTAFIAQGYGYGIGILASGGSTGADGIYALGGGTGAGFHSAGGSSDGAEGIFAEGTGTGPGIYALGGSSGSAFRGIAQGGGHGLRLEGGSISGNGIYAIGGGSGSGIRAIKGTSGYDIYADRQGNLSGSVNSVTSGVVVSANNDKTNYQLASSEKNFDNFTGTMGASQFEKNVFTDTNFTPGYWHKLAQTSDSGNVGGAATDWTTAERSQIRRVLGITGDTTTQASYGFLDVKISTRSTLTSSDNIGINWADVINATTSVNLSGTNISTNQTVARADSVTGVGRISSNLDKTNYSLNSNYLTKADSGSSGASYLRAKHIEDKIGYRLSSQGQADIWINDTTGENSGWAGFFKGRLDANILSRLAPGDSGIMARAPWDNDLITQAQRRIRYVDSLGEEISGGGSATNPDTIANHVWIWNSRTLTSGVGVGTNQVIITTKQSSDSTPIAGAQVQVLNYEQTATMGLLTTNPSGQAAFALDNAIYKVRMFKPGWQFNVPESLVVSGNSTATFYASVFDPGLPPSAALCRVYGWIKDLKDLPVVGVVIDAKIVSIPLRYQSVLISPYYRTTNTDSDGYWYLDLYPNSGLSPSNTQYDFTIYIPYGTILKLKTTVPEQSSWELQW